MVTYSPENVPVVDLTINQGSTFRKGFLWKAGSPPTPVDLTGVTARMQVRRKPDAPHVLLEFSTANGTIVLGGNTGTIELVLTSVATAQLNFESGMYDLILTMPSGDVWRFVQGRLKVTKDVTK
jgi:hypothetical protein